MGKVRFGLEALESPDQQQIIDRLIATFPATFGLRAFPGKIFRISASASYFPSFDDTDPNKALLYTQLQLPNGEWSDWAKGTAPELRAQIVKR
jgi:hypothetical protein